MSLLDDVSIVVTPNGYKAGELYAVVPEPTEGAEEVTNGDFAIDSDWTFGGTSFSAGAILFDNANDNAFQSWSDTVNTLYKLTITKTGSGKLRFRSGFAGSAATKIEIPESGIIYFTSTSDTNRIQIYGDYGSVNATLNSVSVKEYTAADMDVTRATAGTRVDENGLVNYAEILGSELVTNGDFATDLSGWTLSNTDVSNTIVWNNGRADMTADGTTALLLSQTVFEVGKTYKIELDAYNITGSGFKIYDTSEVLVMQLDGHYTLYHTAGTTSLNIYRYTGGQASSGEFDNISVKEVTRDNVPRIDYTGGGCPHILAEPQRTNLITYSEDFTQWSSKINIDVTLNSETSPDGVVNATFINENNSNAQHFIGQSLSITNGQDISISVYAKKNQRDVLQISPSGNYLSTSGYANYDLNNGLVTASGGGVTAEIEGLTNGWFRCVAKFTANNTASGTTAFFLQNSTTASRGSSYDGDGTSGLYMWGAQTEIGSYPTSYIPNFGTLLGVTRNKDIFTRDGIGSLINSTEGVLFVEMAALADDGVAKYLTMNDGSSNNDVRIYFNTASNGISALLKSTTGATQAFLSYTVTDTTEFHKIAFVYAVNRFELWVDGENRAEELSGIAPVGLNTLEFSRPSNFLPLFAKVKQLQVYNTALTDEQLLQLTGESGTDFYESYAEMATALTYTIQ